MFAVPEQFIVRDPLGYLSVPALLIIYFVIFVPGLCAQIWGNMWPNCGPNSAHSGSSPATVDPDIVKLGKVLNLAHDNLHPRTDLLLLVNLSNERGWHLLEGKNMFLRCTN